MKCRASSGPRVPRLTANIGSTPAALHQVMNSLVPNWLVSVLPQARSSRLGRAVLRPYAILPVVAGEKIAARIANDGGAQLLGQRQHVLPKAVAIGRRMPGLVDAAIDAAAHVFDKGPEYASVERRNHEVAIDDNFASQHCLTLRAKAD